MPWEKKSCGQASVIYPLTNHYWILIEGLRDAKNGFKAPASTVTKKLLEERLRLYEAGWHPNDAILEGVLEAVAKLNDKNRLKILEEANKLKAAEGRNASSKAQK